MRLLGEILEKIGAEEMAFVGARYVVLDGCAAYIESVKAVLSFTPDRICVRAGKGTLVVSGECLCIRSFADGDMWISGNVCGVARCSE